MNTSKMFGAVGKRSVEIGSACRAIVACGAIVLTVFITSGVLAQVPEARRQQRREFIEDLLQGLLESQMERPLETQKTTRAPAIGRATPAMIQAREQFKSLSNETGKLIAELQQDELHDPHVRPLLADAMKVKATADLLVQRAAQHHDIQALSGDFGAFDREWRLLAHRLDQSHGLSAKCRACVERIRSFDHQLCGIFGIGPQIDRAELMRLTSAFSNNFQHLLQDIYYDMQGQREVPALLKEGQSLLAQITHAAAIIPHADYQAIVNAYKSCATGWRSYSHKLCGGPFERIRRDVQSIEHIGRQIHEQLWLPVELDRQQLVHLTDATRKEIDHIFQEITLAQILNCRSPGSVLAAARDFRLQCDAFRQSVLANRSLDELNWDFRLFEVQWDELQSHLRGFGLPAIDRQLNEIQFMIADLKQNFADGPSINRHAMQQMLADLDQYSQQLGHDILRLIVVNRYDHGFHEQICGAADSLQNSLRLLRQQPITDGGHAPGNPEFQNVFNHWRVLKPMINSCQPAERTALAKYVSQIEPLMVKLQVVYAN
jgi:hypothetical protein